MSTYPPAYCQPIDLSTVNLSTCQLYTCRSVNCMPVYCQHVNCQPAPTCQLSTCQHVDCRPVNCDLSTVYLSNCRPVNCIPVYCQLVDLSTCLLSTPVDRISYGTSYDESLYETHIVSHIWPFSLPYKIWPWMTLIGQIKVIEFSTDCFS